MKPKITTFKTGAIRDSQDGIMHEEEKIPKVEKRME